MYFGEAVLSINNLPEISAQEIKNICEFANSISIEESFFQILNENASPDSDLKKLCKKGNIDFGKVQTEVNKCAKNVATTIKEDGLTKESKKKIHDYFDELTTSLNNFNISLSASLFNDELKDSSPNKIHSAVGLLIQTVLANTIVTTILSILLGTIGMNISVGLICPMIEELAKQTSIKGGYEKEFFVLFNILEFSTYVIRFFNVKNIVLTRIKTIGLHLSTTIIQYITSNPKIAEKLGAKTEEQKKAARLIGWIAGACVHIGWNSFAIYSASKQPTTPSFNLGGE